MKRFGSVALVYAVFTVAGTATGAWLGDEPVRAGDVGIAAVFAPLLNLFPILVCSADNHFELTLLSWLLSAIGIVLVSRSHALLGLVLVALSSFLMNLATLPRFEGMMSV